MAEGHPRTYGGTYTKTPESQSVMGTSPHLRGNRADCVDIPDTRRDIPAPTGEPDKVGRTADPATGHPRTYGGTAWNGRTGLGEDGTSPHLRGNRQYQFSGAWMIGDIPAPTGEPP